MEKDVRTTLHINEQLSKRFRESCNKMFGDKQGKIKQGYVLAITNFCDQVEQDGKPIPKPPNLSDVLAQKLLEDSTQKEPKSNVVVDQHGTYRFTDVEAKAKKLINKPIQEQLDQLSFGEKLAQAERFTTEDIEAKAKKLTEDRKKASSDHKILQ